MQYSSAILATAAGLISMVSAHGFVQIPPARLAGPAMKAACGAQVYSNQASDNYGNIQGELQVAATQKDYNEAACNIWLCKGFKFEDNKANVQSWTAGQVVDFTFDLRAPHTGVANVSIVDTATNTIIGDPLLTYANFGDNSKTIPTEEKLFNITIPSNLGSKCATAGACVVQHWWDAASIKQSYESCIDFVVGGSGSLIESAPATLPASPASSPASPASSPFTSSCSSTLTAEAKDQATPEASPPQPLSTPTKMHTHPKSSPGLDYSNSTVTSGAHSRVHSKVHSKVQRDQATPEASPPLSTPTKMHTHTKSHPGHDHSNSTVTAGTYSRVHSKVHSKVQRDQATPKASPPLSTPTKMHTHTKSHPGHDHSNSTVTAGTHSRVHSKVHSKGTPLTDSSTATPTPQ